MSSDGEVSKAGERPSSTLTVVIPALNAELTILTQLRALESQRDTFKPLEILVVNNGSSDRTRLIVEEFASSSTNRVRVIDETQRGVNHARNAGIAAAATDYILLCDADDSVSPMWVASMQESLRPDAIVAGQIVEQSSNDEWPTGVPRCVHNFEGLEVPFGGNCGLPRRVWVEAGGFDVALSGPGDESEFFFRALRQGFHLVCAPRAVVYYSVRRPPTIAKAFRRSVRNELHRALASAIARQGWTFNPDGPPVIRGFIWLASRTFLIRSKTDAILVAEAAGRLWGRALARWRHQGIDALVQRRNSSGRRLGG